MLVPSLFRLKEPQLCDVLQTCPGWELFPLCLGRESSKDLNSSQVWKYQLWMESWSSLLKILQWKNLIEPNKSQKRRRAWGSYRLYLEICQIPVMDHLRRMFVSGSLHGYYTSWKRDSMLVYPKSRVFCLFLGTPTFACGCPWIDFLCCFWIEGGNSG